MSELRRFNWPDGLVRHLRLDPECPLDQAAAIREGDHSLRTGPVDIHYTLVVHPKHEHAVEALRARFEADPNIGGPFSPPRDMS